MKRKLENVFDIKQAVLWFGQNCLTVKRALVSQSY